MEYANSRQNCSTGETGIDPVEYLEGYLDLVDVEKDEIGILLYPDVGFNWRNYWMEINYSVHVLEGEHEGEYEFEHTYVYPLLDTKKIFEETYPEMVEQFEEAFTESQLQYYDYEDDDIHIPPR